jgi:hypothetical protein
MESIHVIPAGEFTPSDVGLQAQSEDFDLWRNIMREYAEEFLDVEEAYSRGGHTIELAALLEDLLGALRHQAGR